MRRKYTKRRPYMKKTRRRIRGGTTTPFSELGGIFSGIGNSFQNFLGSFTVMPTAYNPVNNPDITKQLLSPPATQTLNQIYKAAYN